MLTATKRFIKLFFGAAFAAGFVVFSVYNRQPVSIHLFLFAAEMPLFLFAIGCFALGVLTGGMIANLGLWHIKRQHKTTQRRVAALENEIKALHEARE